jgi:pimeloyl-ACP methyl ester carboxylesterase
MHRQPLTSVIAAQWGMAHRRDQTDLLPALQMPSLIIVGEEDMITPPSSAEVMAARLAQATLVRIPNAGHMAPVEQPDAVNKAIGEFVVPL